MNDLWNTLLQWLHRVGLHPDRAEVERAGAAVLDSVTGVAHTVGQAASGMDMASLLALAAALGWASGFRLYLVVFLVGMLGAFRGVKQNIVAGEGIDYSVGLTKNLGRLLFNEYVVPFELASILILAGIVGAVLIGKKDL